MTKKEMFVTILDAFNNVEEIATYCKKEIAKIDKAASAKAEKASAETEMDTRILAALSSVDVPITAGELLENFSADLVGMTVQKLAYRLRKLAETGKVTKESNGRCNVYKLA
jgi:DNA-binding transcriptional ArsR family regulator